MRKLSYSDLIDKTMPIGISNYTPQGELIDRWQSWGTVLTADETPIQVRLYDGELFSLPPDLRAVERVPKGEYRLHSTGEIVVDPDFLSTWNVTRGA